MTLRGVYSRRLSSALTICHVAAVARLADDPVGEGVDEGDDDELGEVYQESQELLCPKSLKLAADKMEKMRLCLRSWKKIIGVSPVLPTIPMGDLPKNFSSPSSKV